MNSDERFTVRGKRVVIFGLGQHGGGAAAVEWCARHGAKEIVVYDRQPESALRTSLNRLNGLPIKLQCGNDDPRAIRAADLVIKNPAVPRDTPLLQEAQRIESDLSLLLAAIAAAAPSQQSPRCIAVTGTKGKSSTVSAIGYGLERAGIKHAVAGNIGVSIFSILDDLDRLEILVLELSSFQLGDLHFALRFKRDALPSLPAWPAVAICTNLYPDHLNYYRTMDEYLRDKALIGACQQSKQWLLLNGTLDQFTYSEQIAKQSAARLMLVSEESTKEERTTASAASATHAALIRRAAASAQIVMRQEGARQEHDVLIGMHEHGNKASETMASAVAATAGIAHNSSDTRTARYSLSSTAFVGRHGYNLALAYAALHCVDAIPQRSQQQQATGVAHSGNTGAAALFADWPGVAHRMELLGGDARLRFVNDTAATIPAAVQTAIRTMQEREPQGVRIYLIAGGSDKRLELDAFVGIAAAVTRLFLLAGSATERIVALLNEAGRHAGKHYDGPFASLAEAFAALLTAVEQDEQNGGDGTATNGDPSQCRSNEAATPKSVAILSPGCASFGMFRHEFDRGEQWRKLVAEYMTTQSKTV